jgi:hypothetical protein
MFINVTLNRVPTPIDRGVFEALIDQSVVRSYAPVIKALESGTISFADLVYYAHKAEIPFPLFFAPRDLVDAQLRIKVKRLLEGFSAKREFSVNSRHRLDLAQVELIVKNLQLKQAWMNKDKTLGRNPIVGLLKKPKETIAEDADRLMAALNLDSSELRDAHNKGEAFNLMVGKLEAQNILVAQSAKDYMPQRLPPGKIFSGMTIKDNKVPFIFIASGDEGESLEPAGRRIFTLTLLAVLVARSKFATVTYSGHTTQGTANREFALTEAILMPEDDFRRMDMSDLDAIKAVSDVFKVTPSAVVMRALRLRMLTRDEADVHLANLKADFDQAKKPPLRSPSPMKALKKFNGQACSRRMLALHDTGAMSTSDFCRVMFSNHHRGERAISDYRAVLG